MEAPTDDFDADVGFLYKTMLMRDPKKRRVKPVQPHLLQLDFGGFEDSSDDSDFEFTTEKKGGSEQSGHGDSDGEVSSSGSSSESDDEDSQSSKDSDSDHNNDKDDSSLPLDHVDLEGTSLDDSNSLMVADYTIESSVMQSGIHKSTNSQKTPSEETGVSSMSSSKRPKIVICCVCLGDSSDEEDEIVDCDGCGVSVHEGCYGITDTQSVASTVSSASTEPWFCDACKAGVKPHCELCPNLGGIFKETDAGKWVHIVCALYIPGVAFADVDKLSPVTLFEMPYSKWGAKECILCDDGRFSRTGVCVGCDAGMCRNYFHVTCAQREGLLSEASPDEEIADPFFAYCKQHAEKTVARAKRRNYLAIQSNMKEKKEAENTDDKDKTRVLRKLNRHRQKYQLSKAKKPPSWVPTEKMPRMLFSSPSATKKLMKKAELLGITTQLEQHGHNSHKDIRKKWHISPALSVDFVSYFLDRNERMTGMKNHLRDLISLREKLQEQERKLRIKYDHLSEFMSDIKETGVNLTQKAEDAWKLLGDLSGKHLILPDILKPKKVTRCPNKKNTSRSPPAGVIHQCSLCHKTNNQHLLAKCDTCRLFYHLGCLDPPLSRMPKKTKLMGWQCSECASSGSDDSDDTGHVDPNSPRRLREKIKEPMKFTPSLMKLQERRRSEVIKGLTKPKRGRVKKRISKPPAKPTETAEQPQQQQQQQHQQHQQQQHQDETTPEIATPKQAKTIKSPKMTGKASVAGKKATKNVKEAQTILECCICLKAGDMTNTVRCDNCTLNYHFQCLDPPQNKSPKYRGYAWFCSACQQDTDDDSSDDDAASLANSLEIKSVRPSPLRPPPTKVISLPKRDSPPDEMPLLTKETDLPTEDGTLQDPTGTHNQTAPDSTNMETDNSFPDNQIDHRGDLSSSDLPDTFGKKATEDTSVKETNQLTSCLEEDPPSLSEKDSDDLSEPSTKRPRTDDPEDDTKSD